MMHFEPSGILRHQLPTLAMDLCHERQMRVQSHDRLCYEVVDMDMRWRQVWAEVP